MRHTDYRTLVSQGRKAGLGTAELYGAMARRPAEAADHSQGRADGNGFISCIDSQGHVVYRPAGTYRRS